MTMMTPRKSDMRTLGRFVADAVVVVLTASATVATSAFAGPSPQQVTFDEARQLVSEATVPDFGDDTVLYDETHYGIGQAEPALGYYQFDVICPQCGLMIQDNVAVNASTGDVWTTFGFNCRQYANSTLIAAQIALRHRLGLSSNDLEQLRKANPPPCTEEPL
jgi:hypothetical protein